MTDQYMTDQALAVELMMLSTKVPYDDGCTLRLAAIRLDPTLTQRNGEPEPHPSTRRTKPTPPRPTHLPESGTVLKGG